MNDLIINDEELYLCSQEMKRFGDNIKGMQESLSVLMTTIAEVVFPTGNIGKNLTYLCEQFSDLQEDLDFLQKQQENYVNKLIEEIEEADKDIYIGE